MGGCCGGFGSLFGGYGMGMFGMFFGLLLLGGLVVGVVLLVVWAARQSGSSGTVIPKAIVSSRTARQILDDRYARGEITREQYLTALSDIGEQSS